MRVGIDGKPLLPPRAGVARYVEGLLDGLTTLAEPDVDIDVIRPRRRRRTLPWVLWDLQRATARGPDIFHFPFYYPSLWPRCPYTVAVFDLLVIEHPQWFSRPRLNPIRALLPRGARRADAVITSASATAASLTDALGVDSARVAVIPLGVDPKRFLVPLPEAMDEVRVRLSLHRPYLLQLGALEPRRGIDLALGALAALHRQHPDLELVLAGEQRAPLGKLVGERPGVRRLGWVADQDLPALLAGAAAVLCPSRGEGFDLPLLEALACGAVVVASDIPVHTEHFAPAVEMFASGEAEALASAIELVLGDSSRAAELRATGPRHAARFTWEETARQHVDLWRQVANR